jgi:hypothetical protein
MGERAHASSQLLAFLRHVGPVEARWALQTALQALQDLPAGEDHIAAVHQALEKAAVADGTGATLQGEPEQPASTSNRLSQIKKGKDLA